MPSIFGGPFSRGPQRFLRSQGQAPSDTRYVNPSGIESGEFDGSATVAAKITATGIETTDQSGAHGTTPTSTASISPQDASGASSLLATLSPSGIESRDAAGFGTIVSVIVANPSGIESSAFVASGSATPSATSGVPSNEQLGADTLTPAIKPAGLEARDERGFGSATPKASPYGIEANANVGTSQETPTIAGVGISTDAATSPQLAARVQPHGIEPTINVGTSVATGKMVGVGIEPSAAVGLGLLAAVVIVSTSPSGIESTSQVGSARLTIMTSPHGIDHHSVGDGLFITALVNPSGISAHAFVGSPHTRTKRESPSNMLNIVEDLVIRSGETLVRTWPLPTGFSVASAPSGELMVRPTRNSDVVSLDLTSVSGAITFDTVALTVTLTISATQTTALIASLSTTHRGRYDMRCVDGAGRTWFPVGGDIDMSQGITH